MAVIREDFSKTDDEKHDRHGEDVKKSDCVSVDVPLQHSETSSEDIKPTSWAERFKSRINQVRGLKFLASLLQIETHGIEPVPRERRTDTRLYELFFVWWSASFNVLNFSAGTIGPAVFGLNIRESIVTILIVDLTTLIIPAFFGVFGPKLGMRSMVQSRYGLGYYGACILSILNAFALQGFLTMNCVIGGQTLASVSENMSWNIGIIIIALIALMLSFCGYRVVHWYENVAWVPNVVTFSIMLGIGSRHFVNDESKPMSNWKDIISFASTLAATNITWTPMVADNGVYHSADASSWRVFGYTYAGYFLSSSIMSGIGASFAASAPFVPHWEEGYRNGTSVGGLLHAVLSPLGTFGDILTVLVALMIPSACCLSMYSCGTSFMTVHPIFQKVPRNVFSIISTSILIPLAIVASKRFYTALVNILTLPGYWTASYVAILLTEHVLFRKTSFDAYNVADWDSPRRLPPGIAAMAAFFLSFALIIPCMSQVWYVGPIARLATGDLGVFVGFASSMIFFSIFRVVELEWIRRKRCDTHFLDDQSGVVIP